MEKTYVLITPARDEEAYIEKTIQSVVSQTILPKKWIIVNDGSTDSTAVIAQKYTAKYDWIELIQMPEHRERHFAAKASCFNTGYQIVKNLKYNVIGNLDADISFEKDYFEFLLEKFSQIPKLGVAGTPFIEDSFHSFKDSFLSVEHVSGACQLFRRECFEAIGGYIPIKSGVDWVAVTTARMKGWKTRTFTERSVFHHRRMGTGNSNFLFARFNHGQKDYYFGGHPLWELFRFFYQMTRKPYVVSGLFLLFGYVWAFLRRVDSPLPQELIKFHRQEQMQRLKSILYNIL